MEFLLIFTIVSSLLFCYYYLFLRKEKRYQFNRFFLLLLLPVSTYAPFLDLGINQSAELSPIIGSTLETITITSSEVNEWAWSYNEMLSFLYSSIALCLLFLFISRLSKVFCLILGGSTQEKIKGATLIHCKENLQTSSFGPYIFWNPSLELSTDEKAQIISHELCHVKQYHSLDILFIELWKVILWFHPLVYFISRELKTIHEYQADKAALKLGDSNSYIQLLLSHMMGQPLQLSHNFFQSTPKNRIMMILRKTNTRLANVKYLLLVPFCSFVLLACTINIHTLPEGYSLIKTSTLAQAQAQQEAIIAPDYDSESPVTEPDQPIRVESIPRNVTDQKNRTLIENYKIDSISLVEEYFKDREEEKRLADAFEDVPDVRISPDEPGIEDYIEVSKEPRPKNIEEIKRLVGYPQIARDAGIQGQVVIRVLVDKQGRYKKHKVVNVIHPILSQAIEKHIDKIQFVPAHKNNNPVQFWVNLPFNFKLLDK